MIGDTVLTDGKGNVVHDNLQGGITATGSVTVAGNVVYNEGEPDSFGIEVQSGAIATENVVYGSFDGIIDDAAGQVTANLVYAVARSALTISTTAAPPRPSRSPTTSFTRTPPAFWTSADTATHRCLSARI